MSTFDPKIHHRHSIRLQGYDYSQAGAYFVTICVHQRECTLGDVTNSKMHLSRFGKIVQYTWNDLPKHYPHIQLDVFSIMPNHVHGVIILIDDHPREPHGLSKVTLPTAGRESHPSPPTDKRHPLSEIVRAFKSFSARRINALRHTPGQPFWQRNYYEHIIRNDREWNAIRTYIANNPFNWQLDRDNIQNIQKLSPPARVEEYMQDVQEILPPLDR